MGASEGLSPGGSPSPRRSRCGPAASLATDMPAPPTRGIGLRHPERAGDHDDQGGDLHGPRVGAEPEAADEGLPPAAGARLRKVVGSARTCLTALTTWSSFRNPSLHRARHGKSALRLGRPVLGEGGRTSSTSTQSSSRIRAISSAPSEVSDLLQTGSSASTISVSWSPASDDVSVAGYGLYLDGRLLPRRRAPPTPSRGCRCAVAFVVGVDAFDGSWQPLVRDHARSLERSVPERAREPRATSDRWNAG